MKIKQIYKAVMTVTCISVITRLLSFIFKVYFSRRLGAEILGVYQITTSIFMLFLCVTTSGLPVTLSRKTAQYDTACQAEHSKRIFSSAMIVAVLISVFFCLLFWFFPSLLNLLFTDKRCKYIFMILLPSLITTSAYCIIRAWFWGKKQFFIYSATEFLEELIKNVLTIILLATPLFAHNAIGGVAWAYVIGDIAICMVLFFLYLRKGGRFNKPLYFKELMKSASPLTGTRIYASVISSMLALLLPSLLIKGGMDAVEATREFGRISGMVMPLVLAPGAVVGALAVVLVPELATANNGGDYVHTHAKIRNAMLLSSAITAICLAAFLSSGDEIGLLLYNDIRAGNLLKSSCILMVPLVLNQFTCTALNSLAQENWTFITHIIGSIVLIILLVILPKYVGIMAYTYSLIGFHSVNLLLNSLRLRKITKISLRYFIDSGIFFVGALLASLLGKELSHVFALLPLIVNVFLTVTITCGTLALMIWIIYLAIYAKPRAKKCLLPTPIV